MYSNESSFEYIQNDPAMIKHKENILNITDDTLKRFKNFYKIFYKENL